MKFNLPGGNVSAGRRGSICLFIYSPSPSLLVSVSTDHATAITETADQDPWEGKVTTFLERCSEQPQATGRSLRLFARSCWARLLRHKHGIVGAPRLHNTG